MKPSQLVVRADRQQLPAGNGYLVGCIDKHGIGHRHAAIGGHDIGEHAGNPNVIGLQQHGQQHGLGPGAAAVINRCDTNIGGRTARRNDDVADLIGHIDHVGHHLHPIRPHHHV